MKMIRIAFYSSMSFALVFSFFSLIFYFGDWHRLVMVFALGSFVGLIAAPEFEPKVFKYPWLFQILGGMLFGIALGVLLQFDLDIVIIMSIVCAFLGLTASYWIKHVPIP